MDELGAYAVHPWWVCTHKPRATKGNAAHIPTGSRKYLQTRVIGAGKDRLTHIFNAGRTNHIDSLRLCVDNPPFPPVFVSSNHLPL